jgi:threonyl-tRNA synthetase
LNGEAAFYGPKLDFMVKDALGDNANWNFRLDYNLPERFDLTYKGSDNDYIDLYDLSFGSMDLLPFY